ncbi:MAG: hypothetical protein FWE07_00580 [Turicibacter sp.]|nr:hypothetical protein [Turicibacter sp.]
MNENSREELEDETGLDPFVMGGVKGEMIADALNVFTTDEKEEEDYGMWGLGVAGVFMLVFSGTSGMGLFDNANEIVSTLVSFAGVVVAVPCAILMFLRLRKRKVLNKIASLVVSSQLRKIDDIARFTGMSENKVIDHLHLLFSNSSGHKLGNDARYLKGGKLDLETMEIKLSDKYTEKEPWTCVYCRAVNEKDALVCSSCHAPKKKV